MRKFGLYILALVVAVFLLAYTMTYTIRFTEAGVKTRFGSAGADSVKRDPGLRFKIPLMDSVTTYDTRPRVSQVRLETQQTKDGRQIIVESFCVWRVSDPLAFFQRFSSAGGAPSEHYRIADDTVKSNLRNAMGAVSKFELGRLFNADQNVDGLGELERDVLSNLAAKAPKAVEGTPAGGEITLATMGIEVVDVGISQIALPQETTTKVFERMAETQNAKAKAITANAESKAEGVKTKAESDARRIESFARQLAAEIRAKGDKEAERYYSMQQENPALAQFLVEVEMLKQVQGRKETTLVLPTTSPILRAIKGDYVDLMMREIDEAAGKKPATGGAK